MVKNPSIEIADNAFEFEKPWVYCILSKDAPVHTFPDFPTDRLVPILGNPKNKQTTKEHASSFLKNPQKFGSK